MAQSYIGKPISLISHSDVRYRGILAGIDPAASTIQLSNVYSMGTESRRPPHEFIPPVQDPYQYIIFRASEVKDLAVDEAIPQRRSVHDDPAVLGASTQLANPSLPPQYPVPAPHIPQVPHHPQQPQPPPPQHQQQPPQPYPTTNGVAPPAQQPHGAQPQPQQRNNNHTHTAQAQPQTQRRNPVHSAAASLETVERAIGDLRVSQAQAQAAQAVVASANHNHNHAPTNPRGGRRGGGRGGSHPHQIKVPTTDFDFESMNAKFDKASLTPRSASVAGKTDAEIKVGGEGEGARVVPEGDKENEGGGGGAKVEGKEEAEIKAAYNPQKSFFDSLSSGTPPAPSGGGGRRGGRGGRGGAGAGGRNRREEERERNVATFGEPGGVGLMGPGAYVGGWGGYGRRGGGGRPRRGGPSGGAVVTARG